LKLNVFEAQSMLASEAALVSLRDIIQKID
jgi:hypothetical protein